MDILNYYATGITANGYISFLDNNLAGLKKIFYITGEADYSSLIEKICVFWEKEQCNIEYIHNPFYNGSLEAIINKSLSIGVVFNINPDMPDYLKSDNKFETIDLSPSIDIDKYNLHRNTLLQLEQNKFNCNESAYLYLAKALKVHDEWEKIYIENMNFKKADELSSDLINKLIGVNSVEKKSVIKHRFLGAATPYGAIDFVPNLTEGIAKRYLIKGRPGTGKSTILKKIGNYASDKGYDVEIYHCGFDHNSLDMIILRELNVCIFDSTSPHEYFPDKENDEIVDVYQEAVTSGTDEKYKNELDNIMMRYKSNIKIATSYLKTMKTINDELINYYKSFTDYSILEEINRKLIKQLE